MWWLLLIPLYIGAAVLGAYAGHCYQKNTENMMQRMISNALKLNKIDDTLAETERIQHQNQQKLTELEQMRPSKQPKPIYPHASKIEIEGVVYKSLIVDGKEYVDIGLYHKALEAFFNKCHRDDP